MGDNKKAVCKRPRMLIFLKAGMVRTVKSNFDCEVHIVDFDSSEDSGSLTRLPNGEGYVYPHNLVELDDVHTIDECFTIIADLREASDE